jgi:uroporphyrinogen-III decarboxylase
MIKEPQAVHASLETLTRGVAAYIISALEAGCAAVSLSDPYAQKILLGERRFREFAAAYQLKLLRLLADSPARGVVHLCPYSFTHLEEYGFITAHSDHAAAAGYEAALLETARGSRGVTFIGRRCPHTKTADCVYRLELV